MQGCFEGPSVGWMLRPPLPLSAACPGPGAGGSLRVSCRKESWPHPDTALTEVQSKLVGLVSKGPRDVQPGGGRVGSSTRKDAAFTRTCKAKCRWRMVTPISLLPSCHHHYQLLGGLWHTGVPLGVQDLPQLFTRAKRVPAPQNIQPTSSSFVFP